MQFKPGDRVVLLRKILDYPAGSRATLLDRNESRSELYDCRLRFDSDRHEVIGSWHLRPLSPLELLAETAV